MEVREPSPTALRFEPDPGFKPPPNNWVYDEWTGEWIEIEEDEYDDDTELWDGPDFSYYADNEDDEYDEYDDLAYDFAYWLTSEEEDRAREITYGLPEGALTLDEWSWRERFFPQAQDEETGSSDEVTDAEEEDPDAPEAVISIPIRRTDHCQNPNGCDQPAKRRGTRCPACYKYRTEHRGEERPVRLINRQRHRQAS